MSFPGRKCLFDLFEHTHTFNPTHGVMHAPHTHAQPRTHTHAHTHTHIHTHMESCMHHTHTHTLTHTQTHAHTHTHTHTHTHSLILRDDQYSSYAYSSHGDGTGLSDGMPSLIQPPSLVCQQQQQPAQVVKAIVYPTQTQLHNLDNVSESYLTVSYCVILYHSVSYCVILCHTVS